MPKPMTNASKAQIQATTLSSQNRAHATGTSGALVRHRATESASRPVPWLGLSYGDGPMPQVATLTVH